MTSCKLKNCKLKDRKLAEKCHAGYREPECWRGWLDGVLYSLTLLFWRPGK